MTIQDPKVARVMTRCVAYPVCTATAMLELGHHFACYLHTGLLLGDESIDSVNVLEDDDA